MRLFTAIGLDPDLRRCIGKIQSELRQHCEKGHFTREDNFHLTLIFLGERESSEIPVIKSAMELSVHDLKPFTLKVSEPGCFTKGSKKILWLGLNGEIESLLHLYSQLENNLMAKNIINQRQNYSAHITIGREVVLKNPMTKIKNNLAIPDIVIPVSKISLMESKRENDRLEYQPIYEKNIGNAPSPSQP